MKIITRDTDYAIRALAFLAKKEDRTISVSELVRVLRIPRPFLRKIMQILNKKGVLLSQRGIGGGFKLAASPKKIFIMDILQIFQGTPSLAECLFKKTLCPDRPFCPLRKKIDSLENYVFSELKKTTIAGLVRQGGKSWPREKS